MDILSHLENLGLTSGEAKVYLALLEGGTSTVGPLVRASQISPSKVYDILERLLRKGIISSVVSGKVRRYQALSPRHLGMLLEEEHIRFEQKLHMQKAAFERLLPALKAREGLTEKKENAEILTGISGIKAFFEMMLADLKPGETELVLGYTKQAGELFDEYFNEYNQRCRKKGIKTQVIFEYDAWFRKKRSARPHASYRYLPKGFHASSFIGIYHDQVGIMTVTETQKFCFLIRNREVAKSYCSYFAFLWKHAINPGSAYKH